MNRLLICVCIFLALVAAGEFFARRTLQSSLAAEKAAHAATRQERDNWKGQAEGALARAEALADTARACLAREARAQADAAERKAIMNEARPRPRADTEKAQVVDDETRKRVAARLNRPL